MELPSKLEFILSPRFWTMIMAALGGILLDPNFPTQPWYVSLGKFLVLAGGGFTAVGTIDNYSKKQVDVARITADVSVADSDKSIGK